MTHPIRVLPLEVVQRIAAGEVVAGASAVVKELIENSIDAGASRVRIDVQDAGLGLIKVTDDGLGIPSSDIELAFTRHATSKISDLHDIERISTLGFRGEALASIAAVADVSLETKSVGEDIGLAITMHYGTIVERVPTVRHTGTTVVVRDLFRDVPARLEMARSDRSEVRDIQSTVRQYAFAAPHVAFHLRIDGQDLLRTNGSRALDEVLVSLYGPGTDGLIAPIGLEEDAGISGFVSTSSLSRRGRNHIHVSVNGRPVLNRDLLDGIEDGYRTFFPRGRHPVAAVRLRLEPGEIDPNIHPAKREVRLASAAALRSQIFEAVRVALASKAARPIDLVDLAPRVLLSEATARLAAAGGSSPADETLRSLKIVGSTTNGLLTAEGVDGLYLIDQHRAHERLIYSRFRNQYRTDLILREELIEPLVVELKPAHAGRLSSRIREFEEIGFHCEQFGGRSFIVRSAPQMMARDAIADSLSESLEANDEIWLDRLLIGLSCRSAVRKGSALPPVEQEALVDALPRTESPTVCPHGSPILLHMSNAFLRRQFGW